MLFNTLNFGLKGPTTQDEVYGLMKKIARETNSKRWNLSYEKSVEEDLELEKPLRAFRRDATGYLKRGSGVQEVELSVNVHQYAGDTLDSTQNYFASISINEPYQWKGGTPTTEDITRIKQYVEDVKKVLMNNANLIEQ